MALGAGGYTQSNYLCPALLAILSTKYTFLLSSPIPFQLPCTCVSQELSPNPVFGLAFRSLPWSNINSCPIDVCRKLQRMFHLQGVKAAIRSQLLAKSMPHPSAWQKIVLNLIAITLNSAPSQCTNILYTKRNSVPRSHKFLLYSPNVILPVSPTNIFLLWFRTTTIGNKWDFSLCVYYRQNLCSTGWTGPRLPRINEIRLYGLSQFSFIFEFIIRLR